MPGKYVPLTDDLYDYVLAQRSNAEDPLLAALQAETKNLGEISQMAISPDQGSLISLLVAVIGAKWAVEVGTFTGASSISIARSLAHGGKLFCFDQDFKYTSIARRHWIKAGVQDKIDLRLGDAHRLLPHFRPQYPLDFVFIDADKEGYDFYFETLLPLVREGGLILLDNMLRGGQVIHPTEKNQPTIRAIDQLNRKLAADPRVQSVLVPIADGLVVCRKLYGSAIEGRRLTDSKRLPQH
ncbi:MAG: class I SAM-dependent methyltransferase [Methylacidiphilales bacterium]|nr:class I SAM-dependent methyltransferase [Candidatus Methylacidiphilales bacterium]